MSTQLTTNQGWIISHDDYIYNLYKNTNTPGNRVTKIFRLKKDLFKIFNPYKAPRNEKSRKRKRSSNSDFSDLIKDIQFVKENFCDLVSEGKRSGIINNSTDSDNTDAKNAAENCFHKSNECNIMNACGRNTNNYSILTTFNEAQFLFPPNCNFYCKDVAEMSETLSGDLFDLILLDPPWWNKYIRRKNAKSSDGYKMMYNDQLETLPIDKLLTKNGLVAVWCTNSPQHFECIKSILFPKWQLEYSANWFWVKVTKAGEPVCTFSDPPGKQPFEKLVFGIRKESEVRIPDSKIVVSVPSALHSHKPPLTELLLPYLPSNPKCLEIFARYLLPGWTSWGMEAIKLQNVCFYESDS